MSAMVEAPVHLVELRAKLEQMLSLAVDYRVAEERLRTLADEIESEEVCLREGAPLLGAVNGAITTAIRNAQVQENDGLSIAQDVQDALDVLDLAISRVDDASLAGSS